MKQMTGGDMQVVYDQINFKKAYYDEYTGEQLPEDLVRAAIIEELNYFSEEGVWENADYAELKGNPKATHVRMRWVLCNKGDEKAPDVRARLVACEIAHEKESAFYASTPPLEAKKWLFSRYARERTRDGKPLQLSFVDVKKAYFYGKPNRDIYMTPPRELGLPASQLAKQTRCVYGTRDAGMIWEETYRAALEGMGFIAGKASPCCFYHEAEGTVFGGPWRRPDGAGFAQGS